MESKILYHGSLDILTEPIVRATKFYKDFGWGFYCTNIKKQAYKWAISRTAFWELVKFRHPTHQISFHTPRALQCLKYNDHEFVTGVDDSAIK